MKRTALRILSLLLALLLGGVLSASAAALTLATAGEPSFASSVGKRFVFATLHDDSLNTYTVVEGAPLLLDLSAGSVFSAPSTAIPSAGGSNTLYLSLVNKSNATSLTLTYHFVGHSTQSETVEQALIVGSEEEQRYYLPAANVDQMTGITVAFHGEEPLEGDLELRALYNLSIFDDSFAEEAEIEICKYQAATNTVEISGSVSYAATVRYAGGTLALFAISPDDNLYLSNQTPIARTGISFSFSFSVEADSIEALCSRYVVAAVSKTGERIPLCRPLYPDISTVSAASPAGFKGFHTTDYADALMAHAGMTVVDVYLDRLVGNQNDGILYAGDRSYYYFDREYVGKLDKEIRNLSAGGGSIYLRFLISATANNLPFASYTESSEGICNKAILVNSDNAMYALAAFTDFLTARYGSTSAVGTLDGIILGRAMNSANRNSFATVSSLSEYTAYYTAALSLIAGVASKNISDIDMVIPLSDNGGSDAISEAALGGDYPADHALYSLLRAIKATSRTPTAFTVMLESTAMPAAVSGETGAVRGIDGLARNMDVIRGLAESFSFLDQHIIYSYTPTALAATEDLQAAFVLQYVYLKTRSEVLAFLADGSLLGEQERNAWVDAISYFAERIDAGRFDVLCTPILSYLGVSSFGELYPGHQKEALYTHDVIYTNLTEQGYASGITPIGSYSLWSFSHAVGTLNWYAGRDCSELSVISGDFGKALTASLRSLGDRKYAEIGHNFTTTENYSFAPYLRFELGIKGKASTPYEVRVQLIGETVIAYGSAVVESGELQTLYLDLSSCAEGLSSVRSMRISARPLDSSSADYSLCLQSVTLQSISYNDEELARRIAEERKEGEPSDEIKDNFKDRTTAIIVTAALIVCSVAIAAVLVVKHHNDKRQEKARETEQS